MDNEARPSFVTIDLVEIPRPGPVQTLLRTTEEDKKDINRAAVALNIGQADFIRTAVIHAARKVLSEVGYVKQQQAPVPSAPSGDENPEAGGPVLGQGAGVLGDGEQKADV